MFDVYQGNIMSGREPQEESINPIVIRILSYSRMDDDTSLTQVKDRILLFDHQLIRLTKYLSLMQLLDSPSHGHARFTRVGIYNFYFILFCAVINFIGRAKTKRRQRKQKDRKNMQTIRIDGV